MFNIGTKEPFDEGEKGEWKSGFKTPHSNFAYKGLFSQSYGFSSSHVWMCKLDSKEGWAQKNVYFWTVVLEKTLESPLDCKEIKPVHPKGDQPWIFIGRTDTEAEVPVLWPPDAKSRLIGKSPDAGKDWRQEEKGMADNTMVGWHHWLNRPEFEQALGRMWRTGKAGVPQSWGCKK